MSGSSWLLGLRRGLTAVLLLLVILVLVVAYLLHSERATSAVISRVLPSLPLDLTVERSSGALADGITLYGVRFRSARVEVDIASAAFEVEMVPLLSMDLRLPSLVLANTTVRIVADAAVSEPAPLTLGRLSAPLPIRIDRLDATNTTIVTDGTITLDRVEGALAWRDTQVTLKKIGVTGSDWSVHADGAVALEDPVPVDIAFDWAWTGRDINGRGHLSGTLAELTVEHELAGAYSLSSNGTAGLLGRIVPTATMTHRCAANCGIDGLTLSDLVLSHKGALDESRVAVEATVATPRLPPTRIVAQGRSRGRALTIDSATARGAGLDMDVRGDVTLAPALNFDLAARVRKLEAALLEPSARGNVAGDVTVAGGGVDRFRAVLTNVTGQLNGYALSGSADVERRGGQFDLRPLQLSLGDNTLVASGTIATDKIDLAVDATLADLSQVDPRFDGELRASGEVSGTARAPSGQVAVNGKDLQVAGLVLGAIDGNVDIDNSGVVDGRIVASALALGERDLGAASLVLGGSIDGVQIEADWQLPELSLATALVANWTDDGVHADVGRAQLEIEALGTWLTDAPFPVDIAAGTTRIGAHTWRNADAFMQVDEVVVGDDIVVTARLADMPLLTFAPLLPPAVNVAGSVNASVALARERGAWRGNVDWRQSNTLLRLARAKTERRMALPTFNLTGTLAGQTVSIDADIRGDYDLSVYGQLDITGAGGEADPTIDGIFAATLPELGWVGPWLDGISEVSGNGALNLRATGTVAEPALRGVIALNDGALSLDDAGLRIENLALRGEGREGATIELTGKASSGGGTLDLSGAVVSPWNERRSVSLNIKGSDVQAFNAQDYQVWISPDLKLVATEKGATVSGRVDIPRADIRVAEVPANVVRTSSDIKVEGRVEEKGVALPLSGDVTLKLGERVHIFALGLDADLRGDLGLTIAEGKEPLFNGRLYLENGKFAAYGQKLSVERGNLYYAGPIENPVLDFRATRAIREAGNDIVAGVRVTGPAQSPAIEVFAEPAMSQTEALSYLILGRSSVTATGTDGETLSQAALAVGLSRSSPLTTQLASGLGLDELRVAGDSLDAAELVAGKQLSDRLYVRYTFGVFSNLGAILLRYRLSERLALEAGSADAHSLDVLYTIEK